MSFPFPTAYPHMPHPLPHPQYPEGYEETQAAKKGKGKAGSDEEATPKRGRKRKSKDASGTPTSKQPRYELSKHQLTLIKKDMANKKMWEELLGATDTVS